MVEAYSAPRVAGAQPPLCNRRDRVGNVLASRTISCFASRPTYSVPLPLPLPTSVTSCTIKQYVHVFVNIHRNYP